MNKQSQFKPKTNPIKAKIHLSSLTFCQSSSVSSFIPEPVTAEMV
jgi:hypothetical protein